jgi:hypothetical protein
VQSSFLKVTALLIWARTSKEALEVACSALFVSLKQIFLKPGGSLIALALIAKQWSQPVGL